MAISDRWFTSERQPDGSWKRVRSGDYGCARRWQVRWATMAEAEELMPTMFGPVREYLARTIETGARPE
jgi:hypothetical protein